MPRFAKHVQGGETNCRAFDIVNGWDLTKPSVQKEVDKILDEGNPELLVVCPPCGHWGGWYHLNQHDLILLERLVNQRVAIKQVDFAVLQIKKQFNCGGRMLVEHPWPSGMWKHPPMAKVLKRLHLCRVDMCAYDLVDPDSEEPILKPPA